MTLTSVHNNDEIKGHNKDAAFQSTSSSPCVTSTSGHKLVPGMDVHSRTVLYHAAPHALYVWLTCSPNHEVRDLGYIRLQRAWGVAA